LPPVDPAAPVERVIDRVVVDLGGDAEEEIPVETFRNGVISLHGRREPLRDAAVVPSKFLRVGGGGRRARDALRPVTPGAIRPDVHFADLANRAGEDVLDSLPLVVERMA